jgi:hypothetical protein
MTKRLLVVVFLAACGGPDVATCDNAWLAFYDEPVISKGCELECVTPPPNFGPNAPPGTLCTVTDPTIHNGAGGPTSCPYFTINGMNGCCMVTGVDAVHFARCEGQ